MKLEVLGVKINSDKHAEIIQYLEERLAKNTQTLIVTPYSEFLVAAQKDEKFRQVLNSADLALPDGIGVLWAAKFLSLPKRGFWRTLLQLKFSLLAIFLHPHYIQEPIPEKIAGADFIWDLAKMASEKKYSIFLLGGFADAPQKAAQVLLHAYPDLKISGTYNGSPAEQGIVERINASGTDFLFLAFGPKSQEIWLAQNRAKLRPRLLIGLGGTFDYLAGKRPYRPNFWAFRGLEWLWRLLTQPWRAVRISKGVLGLIYYAFREKLRNTGRGDKT